MVTSDNETETFPDSLDTLDKETEIFSDNTYPAMME